MSYLPPLMRSRAWTESPNEIFLWCDEGTNSSLLTSPDLRGGESRSIDF